MKLGKLLEILRSAEAPWEIAAYRDQIAELIHAVRIMFGYDQQHPAHQYDLWLHTLHVVCGLPKDIEDNMLFFAVLLHDIGKPCCQNEGEDGNMHYYGHPKEGANIVKNAIIPMLLRRGEELSPEEQARLLYYIEYHDDHVSVKPKHIKRHLKMGVSFEEFRNLMQLQIADAKAHVQIPQVRKRIEICSALAGDEGRKIYQSIRNSEKGKI